MEAHFNLWVEQDGEVLISRWRVRLLEAVARTGSLNAAATEMGVHFRVAWAKVNEMEARLGYPLIERQAGGSGGGGSTLTPAAHDLIARFHAMEAGLDRVIAERFLQFCATQQP